MPFEQDSILVAEMKAGKQKAFNQIVLRYKDKVFNTAYRFLGDYQDANDLTQECFVSVYNNIRRFRGESSLSTWIYSITVNTCKNRLKSADRKRALKTVSLKDKVLESRADNSSPVRMFERKELENSIQNAINSLPDDWREVVVLRDIEELAYEDIATILKCEIGTIKSRLHRARMELKDKLKGCIDNI